MTICMLSLLGMPGTAGFIGKFLIFNAAVETGLETGNTSLVWLVVIAVLNSAISLGYYLRIPATMYFHPAREDAQPGHATFFEGVVLASCAAAILLLGLLPQDALPGVDDAPADGRRERAAARDRRRRDARAVEAVSRVRGNDVAIDVASRRTRRAGARRAASTRLRSEQRGPPARGFAGESGHASCATRLGVPGCGARAPAASRSPLEVGCGRGR